MHLTPKQFHRETPDAGDILFGHVVYMAVVLGRVLREFCLGVADAGHTYQRKHGIAYHTSRILASLLMVSVLGTSLVGIGGTGAFYTDPEESVGNTMTAGLLDMSLEPAGPLSGVVGIEDSGEYSFTATTSLAVGSLGTQYQLTTEYVSGDTGFCDDLIATSTLTASTLSSGSLLATESATTSTFGAWDIIVDLATTTATAHGNTCEVDFVWTGWRDDSSATSTSGYFDVERLRVTLFANLIVMNEVIPNPTGADSQIGVLGEWIELYNNGTTTIDVGGWMLSELTGGGAENFYTIVASSTSSTEWGTMSGATTIASGGFLVVFIEGAKLNNTGDTIRLYDDTVLLLDEFTYTGAMAPEGKSIARIPDGIGAWIDPIPTPGGKNILTEEELPEELLETEELEVVPECRDHIDNDGDGWVDTNDSGCSSEDDLIEGEWEDPNIVEDVATSTLIVLDTDTGTTTPSVEENTEDVAEETATSTDTVLIDTVGTTTPPILEDTGTTTDSVLADTASTTPILIEEIDEGEDNTASSTPPFEEVEEQIEEHTDKITDDPIGEQVPVPDDANQEAPHEEEAPLEEPRVEETIEEVADPTIEESEESEPETSIEEIPETEENT